MTLFTRFGEWHAEVENLIEEIQQRTSLQKNELTDWFLSDAALAYISAQSGPFYPYVRACQDRYGMRPLIPTTYMVGQVFIGLSTLLPLALEKFAKDNVNLTETLSSIFNSFVTRSINKHMAFIAIQAEITTQLHVYQDHNPDVSKADIYKFVIDKFLKYKNTNPEFSQLIDDKIQLMNEYAKYMQQQLSATNTANLTNNSIFKAAHSSVMPEENKKIQSSEAGMQDNLSVIYKF